jgi:uncharacterized membrane protein YeaQ/YmgE (transglycosylase-associated protein family)
LLFHPKDMQNGAFRPEGAEMGTTVGFIGSGFIIGLLARVYRPENERMGLGMTTVLGMTGAVVTGWLGRQAGWYAEGALSGLLLATLGAICLLSLFYAITHRESIERSEGDLLCAPAANSIAPSPKKSSVMKST